MTKSFCSSTSSRSSRLARLRGRTRKISSQSGLTLRRPSSSTISTMLLDPFTKTFPRFHGRSHVAKPRLHSVSQIREDLLRLIQPSKKELTAKPIGIISGKSISHPSKRRHPSPTHSLTSSVKYPTSRVSFPVRLTRIRTSGLRGTLPRNSNTLNRC